MVLFMLSKSLLNSKKKVEQFFQQFNSPPKQSSFFSDTLSKILAAISFFFWLIIPFFKLYKTQFQELSRHDKQWTILQTNLHSYLGHAEMSLEDNDSRIRDFQNGFVNMHQNSLYCQTAFLCHNFSSWVRYTVGRDQWNLKGLWLRPHRCFGPTRCRLYR